MTQTFWIAFGASALAAGVTALGIYTVRRFEAWARTQIVYFISYAAGVLIAASFLHLVPESFAMNGHAAALLLAGCSTPGHIDKGSIRAATFNFIDGGSKAAPK